jgi:uncharacterized membrane protein YphA (DoxX/SURF4 family)
MKANKPAHIIGSISRTILALTFIFSGFVKAIDPLGTVYKIEDYLKAFGGWWTDLLPYAGAAAVCLIALEFVLGVCMLLNVRTKWTSWIALLFYLVMTPLTLYIALKNPVSDCGCFGDALVLTNWQTFAKNVVLISLVFVLLGCKKYIPQTFSWWAELIIALFGLGVAGGLMGYSYTHLPMMDFRPYKVGNNIPELMIQPEPDSIQVVHIMEKDGITRTVTNEEYSSAVKEGWKWISQETTYLKRKGEHFVPMTSSDAPIHDFEIDNIYEGDITDIVLESEEPVALVIVYDLNKTDRKQLDKLASIIHERSKVYFLTGSTEDEIAAFAEELGWDEETAFSTFCITDPVTLKTIVRANPGLIVVQNGNIIEKHNFKQL